MARNSRSEAIRRKKCRSNGVPLDGIEQTMPSGKPILSRRQFAYRHAAVLNAELVAQHYAPAGER